MPIVLVIGALFGFLSVILGAFIDHAWKHRLDSHSLEMMMSALRYHQLYAIIITCIGLVLFTRLNKVLMDRLFIAAGMFSIGILFFSGGIYLAVLLQIKSLTIMTPIGGMLLMLAWLYLLWVALSTEIEKNN